MAKLKRRLLAIAGIVLGIVTLRSLRNRRSKPSEEVVNDVEHADLETSSDHAAAAIEHARVATEKAVESVRERE